MILRPALRSLTLALLAIFLLRADMFPDASNAKLPQARQNLGAGNPVSIVDYGAKADAITMPDGIMAAGSSTLTSATASFTSADVGKKIQVDGANGVWLPPLSTTIVAVTDAHTVTLAAPATKATPRRWLWAAGVATKRTAGNYVPNDLLTLQGGTFTTAAVLKVVSTTVTATTIVAGGTGGVNGACRVQGTTGGGTLFQQDVTIAGGAITAVGTLYVPGHYFTKPTNIAVEPVTNAPGFNCVSTGATLNLTMGVDQAVVTETGKGDYDPVAIPADPIATSAGSISGATGATVTSGGLPFGSFNPTGMFVYGSDDSQALKDSIDAAAASFAQGKPAYVFMPAGNYLIDAITTPLMMSGLGIVGEGTVKTNIIIGANYIGDLFSWSEAWGASWYPGAGTMPQTTRSTTGPRATGFTVNGNRAAATRQNVLMFYDRVDNVFVEDVGISYITGQCMASGIRRIPDYPASMRESSINRLGCMVAGAPGYPAVEFSTEGAGDAVDEIHISDVNIYAPYGDGFVIRNNATNGNPARLFRINKLRIEGLQGGDISADLLRIGDPVMAGPITGIYINQLELQTPYANKAAFRIVTPPGQGGNIYFVKVESGFIGSGMPMGYGVYLDGGRALSFNFTDIYTWNTSWTMTSNAGGAFLDMAGNEQYLAYNLSNPRMLSIPVRKVGTPAYSPAAATPRSQSPNLMAIYPDNTVRGGIDRAGGAVDWQINRNVSDQVANGLASVIGGGDANKIALGAYQGVISGGTGNVITAPLSTISGGQGNSAAGFNTTIPGGTFTNDRGATGGMYLGAPNGCAPFQITGACQRSWHILGAFPATAAAARLTSDGAAPAASGANCVPIPFNGLAYQTVVRATARNWTSNVAASWDAIQGMLSRVGGSTTYLGGAGGAPTQSTGALGTLAVAADATNNCLALTYTPPAGNTNSIHIVATVDVTEVQ